VIGPLWRQAGLKR